jgi:AcrR family transcriptional regulator
MIEMATADADLVLTPDSGNNSRRDQILGAAAITFARSGFHGTSMQEICQEARMSPGAVYRYFRSKEEIIEAIAEVERARNQAILARPHDGVPFVEHVVMLAREFLTEMGRPGEAALMAEVMAEGLRNTAIGKRFQINEAECRAIFRDLMTAAVGRGEIDAPDDFDAGVACLMAIGEGLAFRMAGDPALTIDRVEPLLREVGNALFRPKRDRDGGSAATDKQGTGK